MALFSAAANEICDTMSDLIEVNGTERTVTREFWTAIPIPVSKQESKTVDGNIGAAHPPFGRDQV
jgi:hypothetical protein